MSIFNVKCFANFMQLYTASYEHNHYGILNLKAPRKTASENVVCLCRLLNILANFSKLFLHTGSNEYPQSIFEQKYKKYQFFFN